ncbi:MAG: asparagine synthase-related protein [Pseudomonadota bacterium]|nr:asparagine synthase-related protein [Pseudomonadota bacterium]MDL2354157.1 asparagine synthase-related protein [Pseudomonadota bacterium]
MSGVCGWIGYGASAADNGALIAAMAAPLARFDGAPVQPLHGSKSAAAVAAAAGSAHVYQRDGLMVALWGDARLTDAALARQGAADGIAQTLAEAWRRDPDAVCTQLSGAFALCIVDDGAGEALLAIDRMGTHPMSYRVDGEALLFASSADALVRHPLGRAEIDRQAIYNYVYFHMVPAPRSIYRGQQRLLPGECLRYSKGRISKRQYWKMAFDPQPDQPFEALREEFLDVLKSSVREAAGASRVGAFLSGGTDSSTIAGILTDVGGKPADTYSIGFAAEGYDETGYARIAERHFGTNHHAYYVTQDDVVAAIPQIAAVFDQPFGNASAVPAFYCSRLARADGVTRMLGGDGGDELFGGNERYAKQQVFARYHKLPGLLRKALLEPAIFHFPGAKGIGLMRKARSYIEQASVPMPARLETYNLLGRYGPSQVFTDAFLAGVDVNDPLAALADTYGQQEGASLLNRMLALDMKVTLADNDLPKVIKACELAGMEVAFPFLSDRMVEFSARLTDKQKLNGNQLRYFFKEALRGFLPDEIITKQKHGFGLPFGVWLSDHPALKQLAIDSLHDLKGRAIVRADFIDALVGQHLQEHAGYHGTMVWVLMMLEQWLKQHDSSV